MPTSISLPDLRSWTPDESQAGRLQWDVVNELWLSASRLLLDVERTAVASARSATWLPFDLPPAVTPESKTFLCLVCFENQRMDQQLMIKDCKVRDHTCCIGCAARFFRSRIEQGRVFELVCPVGAAGCGCGIPGDGKEVASASREEVEHVLADDEATLEKYSRFLKAKIDPSLRECPDCKCLCSPALDDCGLPQPEMECTTCGSRFCYYHAAAHRDGSCEEYEVRLAAETKGISDLFGARSCPRCTRQTLKSGGCNHMTCQVCRCEWCWACGEPLAERGPHGEDPVYWHYSDDNVDSGCRQFAQPGASEDAEAVRLWRRERRPGPCIRRLCVPVGSISVAILALAALLALTFWVLIYAASTLVLSLVRLFVKGAYRLRRAKIPDEDFQKLRSQQLVQPTLYLSAIVMAVLFLVPFAVLTLVWDILALVLWACLLLLSSTPGIRRYAPRTTRHHLRFFIAAPINAVHQFGSSTLAHLADRRVQETEDEGLA